MSARPTLLFLHGWGFDATFWDPLRAMLSDWPQRAIDRGYFVGPVDEQVGRQLDEPACEQAGEHLDPQIDVPIRAASTRRATRGDERVVVIGHSFGFLDALMSLAQPADATEGKAPGEVIGNSRSNSIGNAMALISINGFPRFSAADDFPEGVSPRAIDRMMKKIRSAPEAVVSDFRQRCGWQSGVAASPAVSLALPPSFPPSLPPSPANVERLLADLHLLQHGDGREAYSAWQSASLPCLVLAGAQDAIVPAAMTRAAFAAQAIVWRESGDHLLPTNATDWCAREILAFLETLPADAPPARQQ